MAAERFVEVQGLAVRYLEEGHGKPVLLLHGASLGSSADVWARNLGDLAARGLRAVALDLPGFGASAAPPDPSLGFRTSFVPGFLDALGIARASLVGHSQSGRIAVSLAIREPGRLDRAVVVGTASLLPPLEGAAASDAGEGDEGAQAEPTLEETRRALERQLFDPSLATEEAVRLRHRMSTGPAFAAFLARRAAKGAGKAKDGKPLFQRLGEVAVPMRLLYGHQDRDSAARAELARALHPGLDIHLVPRARHLLQWDAPREFAALVGDWLAA